MPAPALLPEKRFNFVPKLNLSEKLIDPKSPDRRPRRAAYALPTFFTAGNVLLGFLAILESFQGALAHALGQVSDSTHHFELAAIMIGGAAVLDGLDGRIARMTNTVSDFGREIDSLADVIAFGIAPAVLAFTWGVQFVDWSTDPAIRQPLVRAGYFFAFLYLLCGAARLARFNVQVNPQPSNPGRPDRKYFVGLPIPAAAAMVASVVYLFESTPIRSWITSVMWMALLGLLSFLMVCTWRFRSFKDFNMGSPLSFKSVILFGSFIYLVMHYSHPVLFAMSFAYMASGMVIRIGGLIRRRMRPASNTPETQQVG